MDLVNVVETTRTRAVALAATLAIGDELASAVASMHLLTSLGKLRTHASNDPVIASARDSVLTQNLRGGASVSSSDVQRLLRWMTARDRSLSTTIDPHLFETCATGVLGEVSFERLYLMKSRFDGCHLASSTFDAALIECCEFERSNLERTSWRGARAVHCNFDGADLSDSTLDAATFVDCSFRGANLSGDPGSTRSTLFVRCDLRETSWSARVIEASRFEACRMHGIHGRATIRGVQIDHADLSAAGDGTQVGHEGEVLGGWLRDH